MDYCLMFIYLLVFKETFGLQAIKLLLPPVVEEGERTILRCMYDRESDSLYAVKWYKGKHEFFRYTQRDSPPLKEFKIPHLFVDVGSSNSSQLVLDNVSRENSGQYTCEVTAEQSFQTIVMSANLLVAHVPKEGPMISDLKLTYHYGQYLKATCHSPPAYPAMNLTLSLNGIPVGEGPYLRRFKPVTLDEDLEVSKISVHRRLLRNSFPSQRLKVRCSAFLYDLYERSVEKSVTLLRIPRPSQITPVFRATALPAEQVPHTTWIFTPGAEEQSGKSSAATINNHHFKWSLTYLVIIAIKLINCINHSS